MTLIKTITALILIFSSVPYAQAPYRFSYLTTKDGLSQSDVRSITQDSAGYMWMATQDGLNRFDGYQFKIYRYDPHDSNSISANYHFCVVAAFDGGVWVGTDGGGLCRYSPRTDNFQRYKASKDGSSILSDFVTSVLPRSDGTVWIGTHLGGLSIYDVKAKKFTNMLGNPGYPGVNKDKTITKLLEDRDGYLWFGTLSNGLVRYDRKTKNVRRFTTGTNPALCSDFITALAEDARGNIWVGTNSGVCVINPARAALRTFRYSVSPVSLSNNYIIDICAQPDNRVWIGTEDGLNLFREETSSFARIPSGTAAAENGLSDNHIKSLFRDRAGLLWIGTHDRGVNLYNPNAKPFYGMERLFPPAENFSGQAFMSVFSDSRGVYWFGTGNGLNSYNPATGKISKYAAPGNRSEDPSPSYVWAVCETKGGIIWYATDRGLFRLNTVSGQVRHFLSAINRDTRFANSFRTLLPSGDSVLWAGRYAGGFTMFDIRKEVFREPGIRGDTLIRSHTVHKMYEDTRGGIWLCGTAGLSKYDPLKKTIQYFFKGKTGSIEAADECITLLPLKNGEFLLGLYGSGIAWFSEKRGVSRRLTVRDGLSNNSIMSMLPAGDTAVWIYTLGGISKYSFASGRFENYSVADGLESQESWVNSSLITQSNLFVAGYTGGMIIFHPDSIRKSGYLPPLAITNFLVMNHAAPGFGEIRDGTNISLPYNQNFVAFEFAALDYANPSKNLYRYKLAGWDGEWTEAGTRRFASYNNLSPGEYKLLLMGSNSDGVWRGAPLEVIITILPPFWATWWFRMLAGGLFAALVFFAYRKRVEYYELETKVHRRFSRMLIESQETERKRIASELHDGIGQNLLIINNRAKMALKAVTREDAQKQIAMVSETALESIAEVRKIAYHLHPYQLDDLGLTKTIQSLAARITEGTGIQVSADIAGIDDVFSEEQAINIFRIVQECLNNIVKHSGAANAKIEIEREAHCVRLRVSDNGKGMHLQREDATILHDGIGIRGIRERVHYLEGKIEFENLAAGGLSVHVQLPVRGDERRI